MAVLNIYNLAGTQTGTVEVKDSVFGLNLIKQYFMKY